MKLVTNNPLKRHYELESPAYADNETTIWTRFDHSFATLKAAQDFIAKRPKHEFRIIQITEKVIHPKKSRHV